MNISIITCTYNPEERILSKVFDAVRRLTLPTDREVEYIIIDNNSSRPLIEFDYVRNFLQDVPWAKVIVEKSQGLSQARLRGFNESTGDLIVFFDDDNVADPEYINEIGQLFENNVQVGIWGPGDIEVVFTDPVSEWAEKNTRGLFQQKKVRALEFGYSMNLSSFHPFGTGMVLRRSVIQFYYDLFTKHGFTTTDRKGGSLASAGDTQLIYAAYKMGFATGVSAKLKMQHLIPGKRTTLKYLCRLHYGIDIVADTAFIELFPEYKSQIRLPSRGSIIKGLVKRSVSPLVFRDRNKYMIEIAIYLSKTMSKFKALQVAEPKWLNSIVRMLQLQS